MSNYYLIVGIVAVVLFLLGEVAFIWFIRSCYKEINEIWEIVKKIQSNLQYDRELFDHHFKVTDQTIIDLREERNELKEKLKKK